MYEVYDEPRERNSEYQQGHVAKTMIFECGPRGTRSEISGPGGSGGGLLNRNAERTGQQKSESKVDKPRHTKVAKRVADIYMYVSGDCEVHVAYSKAL